MKYTLKIKKNNEFQRIYRRGKFSAAKYLTLYSFANRKDCKRIGITVSKKIGKSVKRNRIKRLIRENYRLYEEYILDGYDYIFVARNSDRLPEFHDIRKEMKYLLRKLRVFDEEKWDCQKQRS